jgi:hypothetical protein
MNGNNVIINTEITPSFINIPNNGNLPTKHNIVFVHLEQSYTLIDQKVHISSNLHQ